VSTEKKSKRRHIILTSHPAVIGNRSLPINWGASDPAVRGPIVGTVTDPAQRNVIGTHAGFYSVYRALAVAAGSLDPEHRADLTNTAPAEPLGPFPAWGDPTKIVSLDPFGSNPMAFFKSAYEKGFDIRPSIAVTKAHIKLPELSESMERGRLTADGKVLSKEGDVVVTKAAIEPVWYLPGIAARFKTEETDLRRALFEYTGGMYPELVTRPDLKVFLPPIAGTTIYLMGDLTQLGTPRARVTARVHDECNGSDVFGSDICTCRPYLIHGIEECIRMAQDGGVGVIVYNRKEGRALGEVTKFLVYNARKRQEGGDRADAYFLRTECIAGVQDMRFQELMPDTLHWLGITTIERFISESNMKHDAVVGSGIEIKARISIPEDMIPPDARVEMDAKRAAGYHYQGAVPTKDELAKPKGRGLHE
jgi:GTP cyclohydrolase II